MQKITQPQTVKLMYYNHLNAQSNRKQHQKKWVYVWFGC